jgi:hypothetical protein
MIGFVLSHSLKRYLKETANALGLEHLPIRDFEEFRTDLSSRFGIADQFRRKKVKACPIRSRVNWLRAVDAAMARAAGIRLRANLARSREIPEPVKKALLPITGDLLQAEPHPNSKTFNLSGLAARIVGAAADAELRHREAVAHNEFQTRAKVGTPQYENELRSLEREMHRIQQEADKKIVSPLSVSLMAGLSSTELVLPAISLDEFPSLVRQSFGHPVDAAIIQNLDNVIAEIRAVFHEGGVKPALTDLDIVTLVIAAGMIAEGFDYVDSRGNFKHLYQVRRYAAVFIDEVQDFAEIEILLMGLVTNGVYNQITLSGDRRQRLQSAGAVNYDDLFPWVPRTQHNVTIFLDQNFRQGADLDTLSSAFRSLAQGDGLIKSDRACAALYKHSSRERMADFILRQIRSVPQNATIAVIAPTTDEAQIWFDLLEDELGANHRAALMSRRDDLTRRFNVHFTEVRETKGLEFNVVIIPDIGSFALESEIGRNQAYVAVSRPKHSLILGCAAESIRKPEIDALQQKNIVCVRELPSAH